MFHIASCFLSVARKSKLSEYHVDVITSCFSDNIISKDKNDKIVQIKEKLNSLSAG